MARLKLGINIVWVVSLLSLFSVNILDAQFQEEKERKNILLHDFLSQIGEKFDIYFTLEEFIEEGESNSVRTLSSPSYQINIESALQNIEKNFPDLKIEKNQKHQKIYHLIDIHLSKLDDYPLNKIVQEIHYSGWLTGMLPYIRKKEGIQIYREQPHRVRGGPIVLSEIYFDLTTKVDIQNKQTKVKDLLNDHIPLEKYKRLLWMARTRASDRKKGLYSVITFSGIKCKETEQKEDSMLEKKNSR